MIDDEFRLGVIKGNVVLSVLFCCCDNCGARPHGEVLGDDRYRIRRDRLNPLHLCRPRANGREH